MEMGQYAKMLNYAFNVGMDITSLPIRSLFSSFVAVVVCCQLTQSFIKKCIHENMYKLAARKPSQSKVLGQHEASLQCCDDSSGELLVGCVFYVVRAAVTDKKTATVNNFPESHKLLHTTFGIR